MANLGKFEINTNNEYVDLATLTQITFEADGKYQMQALNAGAAITVCIAESTPTDGGFLMGDKEKFDYTPEAGLNIYVKTGPCGKAYLNIAK